MFNLLYKGCQKNMDKSNVYNKFNIRTAKDDDVQLIYDCMRSVYNGLEDKSMFVCEDIEYVKRNISKHGFTLIADADDGRTAGIFIFEYPGRSIDNLGRDIGLSGEELDRVVHMDTVAVLPQYRGNGLLKRMLNAAEQMIDKNRYVYFMATAAPHNKASLNSFIESGYRIMKTVGKYGGFTRAVLLKEALVSAQHTYESAGFKFVRKREEPYNAEYAGMRIDYEIIVK